MAMLCTLIEVWVTQIYALVKVKQIYAQDLSTLMHESYTSKEKTNKSWTLANGVNAKVFRRTCTAMCGYFEICQKQGG